MNDGIKQLLEAKEGYVVGRLGDELLRLRTERSIITVGPPGSGKGCCSVIPNLLDHPGSAVVIDVDGKTAAQTADARLQCGNQVVVLDPHNLTEGRWGDGGLNPLQHIHPDLQTFHADINSLVEALMYDPEGRSSNNPIWDDSTKILTASYIEFIRRFLPPERQNLTELAQLFLIDKQERAELAKTVGQILAAEPDANNELAGVRRLYSSLAADADNTKLPDHARVSSSVNTSWALDRPFRRLLSSTTFDLSNIQERPTTIYIVVDGAYLERSAPWVRIALETVLRELKWSDELWGLPCSQVLQKNRVLFLLGDLPVWGKLEFLLRQTNIARGKAVNYWLLMQSLEQLLGTYEEHNARTIIGNAAALQFFELESERDNLAQLLGYEIEVASVSVSRTISHSQTDTTGTQSYTSSKSSRRSSSISVNIGQTETSGQAVSRGHSISSGASSNQASLNTQHTLLLLGENGAAITSECAGSIQMAGEG